MTANMFFMKNVLLNIYMFLKKSNINTFILLFVATHVFSCQTNPQKMEVLVKDVEEPVVISQDVEWFYTKNLVAVG